MNIQVIRGDTVQFKFQRVNSDGVILDTPYAMFFSVKETANKERLVFQKTLDDMMMDEEGYWHFTIWPEDTNGKQYGNYVFDVEVIPQENYKSTVAFGTFKLLPEVTWAQNETNGG